MWAFCTEIANCTGCPKKKENYFQDDITSKLGKPHPSNLHCLKAHSVEIKCV